VCIVERLAPVRCPSAATGLMGKASSATWRNTIPCGSVFCVRLLGRLRFDGLGRVCKVPYMEPTPPRYKRNKTQDLTGARPNSPAATVSSTGAGELDTPQDLIRLRVLAALRELATLVARRQGSQRVSLI